jgi:hypothetical protein
MKNVSTWSSLLFGGLIFAAVIPSASAFSVTDVTSGISEGLFADDAQLFDGNDRLRDINEFTGDGVFDGGEWVLLDKTDDSPNPFEGVTFELTADVGDSSGEWSLTWSELDSSGLPLEMDFVFVTKAASNWGAYLFESVTFTSDPLVLNGTYTVSWTNNGGQIPGSSHLSVYARKAEGDTPSPPPPPPGSVPSPGTLLLLLLGLAALRLQASLKRSS